MNQFLKDLTRAMEKSGVDSMSEKDRKELLDVFTSEGVPSVPFDELSDEEKAIECVFKARESGSKNKFRHWIEKALIHDPFCVAAFEALGDDEDDSLFSIAYYKTAMDFGLRKFLSGPKKEQVPVGMFYGVFETRPTIRSMYQYAECLFAIDERRMATDTYKEIVLLNENDNTGARFMLFHLLTALDDTAGFKKYLKQFPNDASCDVNYAIALNTFKYSKDDTAKLEQAKKQAIESNKHVPEIFRKGEMVESSQPFYQMGGEDEANIYLDRYEVFWDEIDGAREWLESW